MQTNNDTHAPEKKYMVPRIRCNRTKASTPQKMRCPRHPQKKTIRSERLSPSGKAAPAKPSPHPK